VDAKYNLNRLGYFVAIVEEKTIKLLEEEIGVNLLVRNTRRLRPSQAGEDFYLRSKEVLIQATEAFESVQEIGREPTGRIRLTAPVDFGVLMNKSISSTNDSILPFA